jgi:hypothetical protein
LLLQLLLHGLRIKEDKIQDDRMAKEFIQMNWRITDVEGKQELCPGVSYAA